MTDLTGHHFANCIAAMSGKVSLMEDRVIDAGARQHHLPAEISAKIVVYANPWLHTIDLYGISKM